jgi:hypothetical protein
MASQADDGKSLAFLQISLPSVACHAGGQFSELTPFGQMFKLEGYTFGERTVPVAVMAINGAIGISRPSASQG